MTTRPILAALMVAVAAGAAGTEWVAAGQDGPARPRIDEIELVRDGQQLAVSFRLAGGLSDEALERIHSSIPLTYRHVVDLLNRRAVPLWPSKLLARARIETTVRYDSLTRRYSLLRKYEVKRRGGKEVLPSSEQRRTTESIEDVRRWMTELRELPSLELPPDTLASRLRVRVESSLGRRYLFYLIPARHTVSAERKLER